MSRLMAMVILADRAARIPALQWAVEAATPGNAT